MSLIEIFHFCWNKKMSHGDPAFVFGNFKSFYRSASPLRASSNCSHHCREENNRNSQSETYDGPAGMEVGGIIESNWDEVVDNFDSMNLKEKLLRGIYAYGFEKPSAIQQRAIIPCIRGRDVIAQAQSGINLPLFSFPSSFVTIAFLCSRL